jgi:hypothetical protein
VSIPRAIIVSQRTLRAGSAGDGLLGGTEGAAGMFVVTYNQHDCWKDFDGGSDTCSIKFLFERLERK